MTPEEIRALVEEYFEENPAPSAADVVMTLTKGKSDEPDPTDC